MKKQASFLYSYITISSTKITENPSLSLQYRTKQEYNKYYICRILAVGEIQEEKL